MRKAKKKTKKQANRKPTRRRRRILPTRTVGLLHNGSSATFEALVQQVLRNTLPGDVVIDARFAADPNSQPIDQIGDALVAAARAAGRRNYVIVAAGGPETALLLRNKTQNLSNPKPAIVFTTVTNPGPTGLGLVNNVNGPGGTNLTGMAGQTSEKDADRLDMLFQLVNPNVQPGSHDTIGVLVADRRPNKNPQFIALQTEANRLGLPNLKRNHLNHGNDVTNSADIVVAFADLINTQFIKGVVVMADSLFNDFRKEVVAIANASGLPTIYQWKEFVDEGGLVSFGPNIVEAYQMTGRYAGQILAGAEPENMQVSTPSTFQVWMKASTAQQLGITIPPTLSAGGIVYAVNTIP